MAQSTEPRTLFYLTVAREDEEPRSVKRAGNGGGVALGLFGGFGRFGGVVGAAGEQVEGVGQDGQDRRQGGYGARGTAGEIDDQGGTEGDADSAAERGQRSLAQAGCAHALGEALDDAVGDEAGGLGRDIAGGQAGAAGGEDQVGGLGVTAQGRGDVVELVGEDFGDRGCQTGLLEQTNDGRAGEVRHLAAGAAVADGEHDGAGIDVMMVRKDGVHRS